MAGRSGGRTMNFIRGGGSNPRVYADGHDRRNDFNFASVRNRTIQRRVPRAFEHRLGEDVSMDGEAQQPRHLNTHRGGFRGRMRGEFRGNPRRHRDRNVKNSDSIHSFGPGWHKVTITNGSSYDRDFILNTIASLTQTPFQPTAYSNLGVNAAFFVEGRTAAEAIARCAGMFSGPDSLPVLLKVDTYGPPPTSTMDEKVESRLKLALDKRHDPIGLSLSLQNFPNSPELVLDYYIPLFRPSVVSKIFSIIPEALTPLLRLDLSNNRLTSLESFQKLPQLTPNLKLLNLSDNKLREVFLLERIKGLSITEITLENNALCDKFQNKEDYIRIVRKIFPKVSKLDGVEYPAPVTFDLEDEKALIPSILPGVSCNEEARRVVEAFVEQYIKIYDGESREPLLDAYHEAAIFTIQCSYNKQGNAGSEPPGSRLTAYLSESRNMTKTQDPNRLERCLHQGKLDIVAFINRLPKTTHDVNGLTIDLPLALPTLINFTITGCFRERGGTKEMALRYFHRTFILTPLNQGFVIINEMLFVTNATNEQIKAAFSLPTQTPINSPSLPSTSQSIELPNIPNLSITSEDVDRKNLIIKQFAKESTMNEAWAAKCLEQNEWDYDKSALVFTELHKNGNIPAEAFIK